MVTQENEHSAYYFTLTATAHPTPTSSPTPCLLYVLPLNEISSWGLKDSC